MGQMFRGDQQRTTNNKQTKKERKGRENIMDENNGTESNVCAP